jgi:hypothetical protein
LMAPVESLPRAHVVGRPCPSQAVQHQRPDRHSPRGLEFLLPRKRGRASVLCVISKKKKGQRLAALPRQTRIKLSFTTPDTTGKACLDSSRRVHNQQNRRTPQRPATFRAWRTARQNVSETSRARECRGSRTAPRPPFFFINQLFPPSPYLFPPANLHSLPLRSTATAPSVSSGNASARPGMPRAEPELGFPAAAAARGSKPPPERRRKKPPPRRRRPAGAAVKPLPLFYFSRSVLTYPPHGLGRALPRLII